MPLPQPRYAMLVAIGGILLAPICLAEPLRFEVPRKFSLGSVSEPIATGDLNGDSRLDNVVANTGADGGPGGDSISVLLGTEAGGPVRGEDFPAGDRPEWITLSDVNGDQILDALLANYAGGTVAALLGDGSGAFGAPILTPVAGNPRCLVAFDLNLDGTVDLATANYDGNTVSVLLGGGNGAFLQIQSLAVGAGPEVITLARLNGDGSPDLLTADALGNSITPLLNDGNGRFTPGASVAVEERPRFVIASDLDGDSLDDLIVANTGTNSISVLKTTPEGPIEAAGRFGVELIGETLLDPVYLALGDLTGDGRQDLLVTWAKSNVLSIHPGTATPFAFDSPRFLATGNTPVGVATGKFDDDNDLDLVVSNALDNNCWVFLTGSASSGILVDNGDAGTTPVGAWIPSEAPFPLGPSSLFSKDGTLYTWQATLPESGLYEAMIWWTITTSRSTSVPIEVLHADGRTTTTVNQQSGVGIWHSLGTFFFDGNASVTTIAPSGDDSACADAVRFRARKDLLEAPRRGSVSLAGATKPEELRVGTNTYLALHATLTASNSSETEVWTGIVIAPRGEGEEVTDIKALRLHVDSNGNGKYDSNDRKLGDSRVFASEARVLTIQGLNEPLLNEVGLDFFLVCELNQSPSGRLKLEVASLGTQGATSLTPSKVKGSPLVSWYFPDPTPFNQRPGDGNQDGNLNISDPVHLLGFLFQGSIARLPCGDGTRNDADNIQLLDSNGDRKIDLSDAVTVLKYLFSGAEPPVLGRNCVIIEGCPDNSLKCSS